MKLSCKLYGCMGFMSLLGLIGVFTEERIFLSFFPFAVDFEYLFKKSDEMMEEYLNKSAALAFYFGIITVAVVTLFSYLFTALNGVEALISGFGYGFAVS
ncbi:MAG: DUF3796 domain-containing protein, partial [Spirochaetales bacterium]